MNRGALRVSNVYSNFTIDQLDRCFTGLLRSVQVTDCVKLLPSLECMPSLYIAEGIFNALNLLQGYQRERTVITMNNLFQAPSPVTEKAAVIALEIPNKGTPSACSRFIVEKIKADNLAFRVVNMRVLNGISAIGTTEEHGSVEELVESLRESILYTMH